MWEFSSLGFDRCMDGLVQSRDEGPVVLDIVGVRVGCPNGIHWAMLG